MTVGAMSDTIPPPTPTTATPHLPSPSPHQPLFLLPHSLDLPPAPYLHFYPHLHCFISLYSFCISFIIYGMGTTIAKVSDHFKFCNITSIHPAEVPLSMSVNLLRLQGEFPASLKKKTHHHNVTFLFVIHKSWQ